jgi:hypothetical protein
MNPAITVLENRLIAFLDVLGFSARLEAETPADVVALYCTFIDEANTKIFQPANELHETTTVSNFAASKFVFDSVVLISHPIDDPRNVSNFVFAATLLLERGFSTKFPLRGAISLGDYVESIDHGVFVSPDFKSLFASEQNLDWSGCCILKKAETVVLSSLHGSVIHPQSARRNHPVVHCAVPIKKQNTELEEKLWALNWCYMLTDHEIEQGLEHLIPAKRAPTAKFVSHVQSLAGTKRDAVTGHQPPLYMRNMPSTTQCRIRFTDQNDEPADPQMEIQVGFDAEL